VTKGEITSKMDLEGVGLSWDGVVKEHETDTGNVLRSWVVRTGMKIFWRNSKVGKECTGCVLTQAFLGLES
jgi:hypothetical protein